MNLEAIKSQLDKLQRFYDFMAAAPENISSIDRDSFLMQLRALYDLVLEEQALPPTTVVQEELIEEVEAPKTSKKGKFVFNKNTEQPKKVTPKQEEKPIEEQKEPVTDEKPPVIETPKIKAAVKKVKTAIKKAVTKTATPKEEQVELKSKELPEQEIKEVEEDYEELFKFKQATDLAAKLSESPIKNLSQAFTLNEKLRYISVLFAGNAANFTAAIDYLNQAADFDAARQYLEQELIGQFDWMKKDKKGLAKDFIKLIRRRYL